MHISLCDVLHISFLWRITHYLLNVLFVSVVISTGKIVKKIQTGSKEEVREKMQVIYGVKYPIKNIQLW